MTKTRYRRYIFWVNILSFHLSAFVKELAKEHEVWFAYEQDLPDHLSSNGWLVPDFGDANLADVRDARVRGQLLAETDKSTCHCFGNYLNLPIANQAYQTTSRHECGAVWISEPFNFQGFRGWIRTNRVRYHAFRDAAKNFDLVFGMGELGVNFFRSAWIPQSRLREFIYCVEPQAVQVPAPNAVFTLVFVGQLIERKGVDLLLKALSKIGDKPWTLNLIGSGSSGQKFMTLARALGINDRVHFLGPKSNSDVARYIAEADSLVLPSRWDGWGAVVNEALMAGTPVVVSDRCGASTLIANNIQNGLSFSGSDTASMAIALNRMLEAGIRETESREQIRSWANASISGRCVAEYFIESLKQTEPILPPWKSLHGLTQL